MIAQPGLARDEVLRIWEVGERLGSTARSLLLLGRGASGADADALADLTIGQRDARLLALRERTFGDRLAALGACVHCGALVEYSLRCADLWATAPGACDGAGHTLVFEDRRVRFRLPTSRDLEALRGEDLTELATLLAERCIEPGDIEGERPEPALALALSRRMAELDPPADTTVDLRCAECGGESTLLFDIGDFFWQELRGYAHRLLEDIHTLARAYGWREADVLALSDTRRALYLQLVT
jgi:hypothetical protein